MAKFFQHIDPSDEYFQTVTKLLYVDDEDPDMVMYVFEDGSKCNQLYVASLNDVEAFDSKKCFAEVSSPNNLWKFNKREVKANKQYATGKDGQQYEIVDYYMYDHNKEKIVNYDTIPPVRVLSSNKEDVKGYYLSYIVENKDSNIPNVDVSRVLEVAGLSQHVEETPVQQPSMIVSQEVKPQIVQVSEPVNNDVLDVAPSITEEVKLQGVNLSEDDLCFNLDELGDDFSITVISDGKVLRYKPNDFVNNALLEPEERIVEKIVEKEVNVGELPIKTKDSPEYNLVNNMINMSKKEECTISMELDIPLPPNSVYDLICSAYSDGMDKAFLRIIANNMSVRDLRIAVEQGLTSYYKGEGDYIDFESESSNVNPADVDEEK